uniref:C2H2-type domain-containing protein n=1 Tax=Parastrongyloides trichosuri TaxID=131310 RepID=A0A0N4Z4Z1_PARTI
MESLSNPPLIARLAFDAEDNLPEEYYTVLRNEQVKEKAKNFKKIEPDEWVKAKEFVPSNIIKNSKTHEYLAQTFFDNQGINDLNYMYQQDYTVFPYNAPVNNKFYDTNYQNNINGFVTNYPAPHIYPYRETFSTTSSQSTGSVNSMKKRKRNNKFNKNKRNVSIKVQYQKANEAFNKICSQNSKSFNNNININYKKNISRSLSNLSSIGRKNLNLSSNNTDFSLKSETKLICNSCPSLSLNQLTLWDEVLHNIKSIHNEALNHQKNIETAANICNNDKKNNDKGEENIIENNNSLNVDESIKPSVMKSSTYEMVDVNTFECLDEAAHFNRIRSKEIRFLEKQINGLKMENSFNEETMVEKINNLPYQHQKMKENPAYEQKSLQSELEEIEDLQFKPVITKYGYPQHDVNFLNIHNHMTTYDINGGQTGTSIVNPNYFYSNNNNLHVDYIDGWECDENTFQNPDYCKNQNIISSSIQTSLWNRMQWLFKQRHPTIEKITPSMEHDNACCVLM